VVFNFDNADIEVVIHAASEVLGFNYVLEPEVKGKKVTVQTSGRIAQEDVFKVLLAILEVHGVTAIKSENLYKIVRLEGARERPVPTIVGPDPDPSRVGDEVITQIVPLKFASAAELSGLLRPLISARGSLVTYRETNLLVVTDAASNVRRILEIVKLVDVPVTLEELQVIALKFADAQELANVLNQLFAPGRVRPPAPVPSLPAPPVPGAPPAAPRPPETPTPERPPLIVAYRGINVLIVQARKPEMEAIRRLIAQLDVDIYGGRRVFIYFAENTKAKDLTATMSAIYGRAEAAPPTRPTPAPSGAPPPPSPPPPARPAGGPGAPEAGLVEGEVRFIADEVTNAVIVTTFPRNWAEIEGTLKKLDRMPRQVLIEVLVAEVTLDDQTSLGIEWAVRQGRFDIFQAPSGTFAGRPTFRVPPLPVTGLGQGLSFFTFQTSQFFTLLNALASEDKVNVLSSPSIMTTENKKAVINVSTSVPVVTSQQVPIAAGGTGVTATQTVEFKDAGVILTVTPRIGEKGTVALDIKQEVNDVGPEETTLKIRSFTKREAETSVVLLNNQTLVMGGLIKNTREILRTGIPLLSKIPVLGFLFGITKETIKKTELILLITPRVIGTALDAARITEEMKRITPEIQGAIKQAPGPPSPAPTPPGPPSVPESPPRQ